jgi:nitrate reductase NapE component
VRRLYKSFGVKGLKKNAQDGKCEDSETELFTYLTFFLLPNISVDVVHD